MDKMGGTCDMHREERCMSRVLEGKVKERPLGRTRPRQKYNIKMYLKEIRWEGMGWIHWAWDRDQRWTYVNMVKNLWIP